jgi:hypothetical protein
MTDYEKKMVVLLEGMINVLAIGIQLHLSHDRNLMFPDPKKVEAFHSAIRTVLARVDKDG